MLKFCTVIVITSFIVNYASSNYDFDALPQLKIRKSNENPPALTVSIEGYSCPAETINEINNLRKAVQNKIQPSPKLAYCVFEKPKQEAQNPKCENEVRPILLAPRDVEENKIKCGIPSSDDQFLFTFSYYRCGSKQNLNEFQDELVREDPIQFYKGKKILVDMYDVCYDTLINEAIWTRHTILKPVAFDKLDIVHKSYEKSFEGEINLDPFFILNSPFERIKEIYDSENEKDESLPRQQPQPIVPFEHFAFDIWKKSAKHIINMAPLRDTLVPLMSAINIGLKKAQMKLYHLNPISYSNLKFYTRVIRFGITRKPNEEPTAKNILQSNIWHKFIYDKMEKKGLSIYIHNTSDDPPTIDEKNCNGDSAVRCEFKKWIDDVKIETSIDKNDLKFAYCCAVNEALIKSVFNLEVEIKGTLDINALIVTQQSAKRKVRERSIFEILKQEDTSKRAKESIEVNDDQKNE